MNDTKTMSSFYQKNNHKVLKLAPTQKVRAHIVIHSKFSITYCASYLSNNYYTVVEIKLIYKNTLK